MLDAMLEFLRALQIDARMARVERGRTLLASPTPTALPSVGRTEVSERMMLIAGGALFGFSLCYALFVVGVL
jgi:hypothetical protein